MRSARGVSTGLAYDVASPSTCGGAASPSQGVSLVDARRDASWLPDWLPPGGPSFAPIERPRPRKKAAARLIAGKDHAVTHEGACSQPRRCYSASPPGVRHFCAETGGQRIREGGDTGDTCPRGLSPKITLVPAGQTPYVDSGDRGSFSDLARGWPGLGASHVPGSTAASPLLPARPAGNGPSTSAAIARSAAPDTRQRAINSCALAAHGVALDAQQNVARRERNA